MTMSSIHLHLSSCLKRTTAPLRSHIGPVLPMRHITPCFGWHGFLLKDATARVPQVGLVLGRLVLRSASAIRASVLIHDGMAKGLLQSPLSFFHRSAPFQHATAARN